MNDSIIPPMLDRLVPALRGLDKNRLLFGFPKTLRQVHMLRERNVYPDKVLVVNYPRDRLVANLAAKLGNKFPESTDAVKRAHELLEEYEQNLKQVKEVYRDIILEVDSGKEVVDARVEFDLTQFLKAFSPANMGPRRAVNILVTGPPSKLLVDHSLGQVKSLKAHC